MGVTQFGVRDYSFSYTVPLNTWTHLAIVSNGATNQTTLYANGVSQGTISGTVPLPMGAIGGRRSIGGVVDQVNVYYQALTATEVGSDMGGAGTNLALNQPATASSVETASFPASNAVDGSMSTRWSSLRSDPQRIRVDLGSTRTINRVRIFWEAAYASRYEIQVSSDDRTWTTISTQTSDGGTDDVTGLSGSGRYLRINCLSRATTYGDSIWELEAYGS